MPERGRTAERSAYVPGYGEAAHHYMAVRSATAVADFLLAHVTPGMRLLDLGCGPGTITVGLAEAVAPGSVVAIDIEPAQLTRTQALTIKQDVTAVHLAATDLFALPFADASFDAAFAHAVLMHVGDRPAALREVRRVLKPGGVVGLKDLDMAHNILEPEEPLLTEFLTLLDRARSLRGVATSLPQRYRALLREAGFIDVTASAGCVASGDLEATRRIAALHIAQATGAPFRRACLEQAWAGEERLDAIVAALRAWGERPDAFRLEIWCAAVGYVDAGR